MFLLRVSSYPCKCRRAVVHVNAGGERPQPESDGRRSDLCEEKRGMRAERGGKRVSGISQKALYFQHPLISDPDKVHAHTHTHTHTHTQDMFNYIVSKAAQQTVLSL